MCDTVCARLDDRTLFAKNSDRPPTEVQLIEAHDRRASGGSLSTQYLTIPDLGASALIGARPDWLWGMEHGLNEHRVAIGNEQLYTAEVAQKEPGALIGMDLVRLGLERARSAEEALGVITSLLGEHGQAGVANREHDISYFSSFLIADPSDAYVLETSGSEWVAREVATGAAISNRVTIGTDWTSGSASIPESFDAQRWLDPDSPTGHADKRLACTRPFVTGTAETVVAATAAADGADAEISPRALASLMRHHGTTRWGAPGGPAGDVCPPPESVAADGTGVTVCMHVRDFSVTTSSLIAELPLDPDCAPRAWVAPGSPCVSVYLPVFLPDLVPEALAQPSAWRRFADLRDRVEADGDALGEIRAVLAPLETGIWDEADGLLPAEQPGFVSRSWSLVSNALDELGV